jgi:hypothetical protein
MYNIFVGLGGTGTQIADAISNLYPFLQDAGITNAPFELYILDKDTNSGIFDSCSKAHTRYRNSAYLFPFEKLEPYQFVGTAYQELQGNLQNNDYTVLDLIGNDSSIQELAAMCWPAEKRNESLRDGNNRDPSRGSLDAHVCLGSFDQCALYRGIQKAKDERGEENIRIVVLGGATGGMGSSLIVPLVKKLKEYFVDIRIDLVILGTYFSIPTGGKGVNNIGTSFDSFFRAADQIEELSDLVHNDNDWRVYYTAMPGFDNICGEFKKNGATKRKAHLLELLAAIAAFDLEGREGGFYQTALPYDKSKNDAVVEWNAIQFGAQLKSSTTAFMKLLSMLTRLMPTLSLDINGVKKDPYLQEYFLKKPAKDFELIEKMRDILKEWLKNVVPYFMFWYEIQSKSGLARESGKNPVEFFKPEKDLIVLEKLLADSILDSASKQAQSSANILPFGVNWTTFIENLKPDQNQIRKNLNNHDQNRDEAAKLMLALMLKDIYKSLDGTEAS